MTISLDRKCFDNIIFFSFFILFHIPFPHSSFDTRYMNKAMLFRGHPKEILSDNGPEFTSNALNAWAYEKYIEHVFIDSGKPMENGFIESFNGKLRDLPKLS